MRRLDPGSPVRRLRRVEAGVLLLAVLSLVAYFLAYLAHGYTPVDDLLRHVGYVFSGRDWADIALWRADIDMRVDTHPGFHFLLGVFAFFTRDPEALLLWGGIFPFTVLALALCVEKRRLEAVLLVFLFWLMLEPGMFGRLMLGRPFVLTGAAFVFWLSLWSVPWARQQPHKLGVVMLVTAMLQTWMHPVWYLNAIPVGLLLLAGLFTQAWRKTAWMVGGLLVGTLLGLALTGDFFGSSSYAWKNLLWLYFSEWQPPQSELTGGEPNRFLLVLGGAYLVFRLLVKKEGRLTPLSHPLVLASVLLFIGQFYVSRFWTDFGCLALFAWWARDLSILLQTHTARHSYQRLLLTGITSLALTGIAYQQGKHYKESYLAPHRDYYTKLFAARPDLLPDGDGVLYNDNLQAFYFFFWLQPEASWRFAQTFEHVLAPEDVRTRFLLLKDEPKVVDYAAAWLELATPQDRLLLKVSNA